MNLDQRSAIYAGRVMRVLRAPGMTDAQREAALDRLDAEFTVPEVRADAHPVPSVPAAVRSGSPRPAISKEAA